MPPPTLSVYLKKEPGAMKPIPRFVLWPILGSSLISSGCRGGADHQMVFTAPRVAPVQADSKDRGRGKAPLAAIPAPANNQIPASNGVDVPIVKSE